MSVDRPQSDLQDRKLPSPLRELIDKYRLAPRFHFQLLSLFSGALYLAQHCEMAAKSQTEAATRGRKREMGILDKTIELFESEQSAVRLIGARVEIDYGDLVHKLSLVRNGIKEEEDWLDKTGQHFMASKQGPTSNYALRFIIRDLAYIYIYSGHNLHLNNHNINGDPNENFVMFVANYFNAMTECGHIHPGDNWPEAFDSSVHAALSKRHIDFVHKKLICQFTLDLIEKDESSNSTQRAEAVFSKYRQWCREHNYFCIGEKSRFVDLWNSRAEWMPGVNANTESATLKP